MNKKWIWIKRWSCTALCWIWKTICSSFRWVCGNKVLSLLTTILLSLLALFFLVAFGAECWTEMAKQWLGNREGKEGGKRSILTFIGWAMGGVLLAIGAVVANKRADAMQKSADEDSQNNRLTEKGHRHERFKIAIEHLGYDKAAVRIGAAYEMYYLAKEHSEMRKPIFKILCVHIRRKTTQDKYIEDRKKRAERDNTSEWPSEEIQTILDLLFKQDEGVFDGLCANLQGARLIGADLFGAKLQNAFLAQAQLQWSFLQHAHLQNANLRLAKMQFAELESVNMQGANLTDVSAQYADMTRAKLHGAFLNRTEFQKTTLVEAEFYGALLKAGFQGAHLTKAVFSGVHFGEHFPDFPAEGEFKHEFKENIKASVGKPNCLVYSVFSGDLEKDWVEKTAQELGKINNLATADIFRRRMSEHIDKPASRELPKDMGIITTPYTQEDADKWIAEYNEATGIKPGKK